MPGRWPKKTPKRRYRSNHQKEKNNRRLEAYYEKKKKVNIEIQSLCWESYQLLDLVLFSIKSQNLEAAIASISTIINTSAGERGQVSCREHHQQWSDFRPRGSPSEVLHLSWIHLVDCRWNLVHGPMQDASLPPHRLYGSVNQKVNWLIDKIIPSINWRNVFLVMLVLHVPTADASLTTLSTSRMERDLSKNQWSKKFTTPASLHSLGKQLNAMQSTFLATIEWSSSVTPTEFKLIVKWKLSLLLLNLI